MAIFPAIPPNTRGYDLAGDFPGAIEETWPPGTEVRFRFGSDPALAAGLVLELGWLTLTSSQAQQIRDHHAGQMGGTIPFALPAVITQGHDPQLVPVNHQWRYTSPPTETQRPGGRVDVTVRLEAEAYLTA